MHAFQNIRAVTDGKPASINSMMATPAYRSVSRMLAAAGLEHKLASTGKLSVAEVDAALNTTNVSGVRRIELKTALSRLGLLS